MLVDTGSPQPIVDARYHKTLLYTNAITPFSTQLRGANSKSLQCLGKTTMKLKI